MFWFGPYPIRSKRAILCVFHFYTKIFGSVFVVSSTFSKVSPSWQSYQHTPLILVSCASPLPIDELDLWLVSYRSDWNLFIKGIIYVHMPWFYNSSPDMNNHRDTPKNSQDLGRRWTWQSRVYLSHLLLPRRDDQSSNLQEIKSVVSRIRCLIVCLLCFVS